MLSGLFNREHKWRLDKEKSDMSQNLYYTCLKTGDRKVHLIIGRMMEMPDLQWLGSGSGKYCIEQRGEKTYWSDTRKAPKGPIEVRTQTGILRV